VTAVLPSRWCRALRGPIAVLALAALTLVPLAPARSAPNAAPQPITLKVMEFNTEYGGIHVSFDKVIQAIRKGGADVVGVEEAQGHTARMARALGWPYYSSRLQILSKFPIIDPPGGNSIYVFIEVTPGQVVAIENVHLPSNPYGPFWVKQGYSREDVIAKERELRLPAVRPSLHAAKALIAQGIPVFLTGDFNTPSWRDWTPQMVGVRDQIRYPVKWPVSVAVERAGFVDSYRDVHPSPLQDPGLTWWAARPRLPGWNPGKTAPEDRIDFVYAAGAAQATRSIIVGERGHVGVDVGISPWPSDHRATVSTFEVTPAVTPVLVAVQQRLLPVGKDVVTTFHTPGVGDEQVAVVPAGGDPATDAIDTQPTGAAADGTLTFATGTWQAGDYEAVLLDGAGGELSRIAFWLKTPGTGPVIATGMSSYARGEPIDVTWSNVRGERWDWIGVYHRGADPHVAYYLLWAYTGATVEGSLVLDDNANGRFPLNAGKYSVYILRDDGYVKMAGADFTITSAN
jgi:endonuclease/exonuclease/phosphatase family metal-dependent hydrolase